MPYLSNVSKYFNIIKDFILNLSGNFLVIAVTQLLIFPLLSHDFNKAIFGSITSVYGINSIIIAFTGDSLANVRIISNNKNGIDFNLLSIFYTFSFSFVVSFILFNVYGRNLTLVDNLIFTFTTSIMSILEYGISLYRIQLKYKLYLYQNIIISIGYIIGIIIFRYVHMWSVIFLFGNLLGIIFFIFKSGILNEHIRYSINIIKIIRQLFNISMGDILDSTISNLDRLVIPIILGITYLPVFFSANTLAKMFSLIMGPLSSVLLSHLSKLKIKWTIYKLNKITFILVIFGIILIIPSYFITIFLMKFLYGTIFYTSPHIDLIILFSCIATSLFEIWNIINVVYLICLKSKFQVFINFSFFICYLIMSVLLSHYFNLVGYSLGYALAIIIGLCISVFSANRKCFWKS